MASKRPSMTSLRMCATRVSFLAPAQNPLHRTQRVFEGLESATSLLEGGDHAREQIPEAMPVQESGRGQQAGANWEFPPAVTCTAVRPFGSVEGPGVLAPGSGPFREPFMRLARLRGWTTLPEYPKPCLHPNP